jgi:hypothetical protein
MEETFFASVGKLLVHRREIFMVLRHIRCNIENQKSPFVLSSGDNPVFLRRHEDADVVLELE